MKASLAKSILLNVILELLRANRAGSGKGRLLRWTVPRRFGSLAGRERRRAAAIPRIGACRGSNGAPPELIASLIHHIENDRVAGITTTTLQLTVPRVPLI
jgi:hypothetical protein